MKNLKKKVGGLKNRENLIKKHKKIIISIIIFIILILYLVFSYYGLLIFNKGYNEIDLLLFNIIGDTVLVGVVTYISTKSVSLYVSKKEFDRNTKINVSVNEKIITILNYNVFLDLYSDSNKFFCMDGKCIDLLTDFYKKYNIIKTALNMDNSNYSNSMIENILNIPFNRSFFTDENLEESYKEVFEKFAKDDNDIRILETILSDDEEGIKKFSEVANIISKVKHYEIVNLNSVEGCQLLVLANNKVVSKISCLPNQRYNIYMYFEQDKWIQFIAFSYDYDGKEIATNLVGMKYTNADIENKPISINLEDYINIK